MTKSFALKKDNNKPNQFVHNARRLLRATNFLKIRFTLLLVLVHENQNLNSTSRKNAVRFGLPNSDVPIEFPLVSYWIVLVHSFAHVGYLANVQCLVGAFCVLKYSFCLLW